VTVNPLTTSPTPPNSNVDRALFVWGDTPGSPLDPIATDALQNALLSTCAANGVNLLYLDMWNYLGSSNWTLANRNTVKKFVSAANQSGIRVHALAGNVDWGHNLQWVGQHILRRVAEFNVEARSVSGASYEGAQFDGFMFDVEFYTIAGFDAQVEVPGLLDLMRSARQILGKSVGCFATAWLINAPDITYNGETKSPGRHMMDVADHVAVGCYADNGDAQIALFQPWFDYAAASPGSAGLWCGSEVALGSPDGYRGQSRAAMEEQHTAISNAFALPSSLAFRGQCIDAYLPYSTMP
jgi:hypothetical protein